MREARKVDATGIMGLSTVPALSGRSLFVFHPIAVPSTVLVQVQAHTWDQRDTGYLGPSGREKLPSSMYRPEGDAASVFPHCWTL